jgi:hypothetical protein
MDDGFVRVVELRPPEGGEPGTGYRGTCRWYVGCRMVWRCTRR